MWGLEHRANFERRGLRYPSDLTDVEWALVAPLIPPAKRGGNKRRVDMRSVVDGMLYVLTTGSQWRALPKDLAPRSTVHGYFDSWLADGTLTRIHQALFINSNRRFGKLEIATTDHMAVNAAIIKSNSASIMCQTKLAKIEARRSRMLTKLVRGNFVRI